jgi:hypothetical protein
VVHSPITPMRVLIVRNDLCGREEQYLREGLLDSLVQGTI